MLYLWNDNVAGATVTKVDTVSRDIMFSLSRLLCLLSVRSNSSEYVQLNCMSHVILVLLLLGKICYEYNISLACNE